MIRRRVIVIAAVCWLPLLVLTGLQHQVAAAARVAVPFLLDVRCTPACSWRCPCLIVAEHVVHQRLRHVVALFLERGLITEDGEAQVRCRRSHPAMRLAQLGARGAPAVAFVLRRQDAGRVASLHVARCRHLQ